MSKSHVMVDLAYLNALEDDSKILEALRIVGVGNWEGYELAQAIVNTEEDPCSHEDYE